jgi:glucose/arabinose dehydrogenase
MLRRLVFALVLLTMMPKVSLTAAAQGAAPAIGFEEYATGLDMPVSIAHAGDGSGRLFVVEQGGTIAVIEDGTVQDGRFLDISDRITRDGTEQGLLGLAFAPDFAETGVFYTYYTATNGDNTLSRFQSDGVAADPASEEVLFAVEDYAANHNGGQLAFGPDGMLYVGLGDGGGQGDPESNGQDTSTLLGSVLRIDVSGETGYEIPADNPFVDDPDAAGEIWAYGLRNPWRFSFDAETGDLFIADVGQNEFEEIDYAPAGVGGLNFGWSDMEASTCYNDDACDAAANEQELPILEYDHGTGGCSVTGGYVYRGSAVPDLVGAYVYGDYCSGLVWVATGEGDAWEAGEPVESGLLISTFGVDEANELYVADLTSGTIYQVVAG